MTIGSLALDIRTIAPENTAVLVRISDKFGVTTARVLQADDRAGLEAAILQHVHLSQATTRRN